MIIYIKKYTFILLISLVFDIMYINNGITKEGEQCKFIEWTWAVVINFVGFNVVMTKFLNP